jgi:alkylation response protein AidB-like acyl-CoA dehydrogenase
MAAFAGKLFSRTTKASFSLSPASSRSLSSVLVESYYNEEQKEMQSTLRKIIDKEINPHTDKWEREQMWPGHEVIKKLGNAGFLGMACPLLSSVCSPIRVLYVVCQFL